MVKCTAIFKPIAGYSLFETMLVLILIQGSLWFIFPQMNEIRLRWQAQQVLRQVHNMMEYARWTALMKHTLLKVVMKDRHLELVNAQHKVLLATTNWPDDIQVEWHGFARHLPLIFESEIAEQHVNGIWTIFIHGKLYQRYVMNRLGHGRYDAQ